MSSLGPNFHHIYRLVCGSEDSGWRLRPGWELLGILDHSFQPDGSYTLTLHVRLLPDYVGASHWPPVAFDSVDPEPS